MPLNWIDVIYLLFATLVTFFGFLFVLLYVKNRGMLAKVPFMEKFPTVSIIVPAYNEADNIAKVLRNLKNLEYPKGYSYKLGKGSKGSYEIIVVDDGSTDETAAIAEAVGVQTVRKKRGGKASALNEGLAKAKGEIIVCVDSDSYPDRTSLVQGVPFFAEKDVAAVTSRIFVNNAKGFLGRLQSIEYAMIAWTRKLFEYIDSIYVTPGPLSFYRADVLKEVGGFDEKNLTEDIEIAWRLLDRGYKIKMSPGTVLTEVPSSFKAWWKQRIRWNVGGMQTLNKYKGSVFRADAFGSFILPFFTLSYGLALLALSLFVYLIYLWAFNNILFIISAQAAGLSPLKHLAPFFLPDMFTIFGVIIFAFSIFLVGAGLKEMQMKSTAGNWIGVFIYLTIYITLFPFILVHSIIRYLRGKRGW
ncbi:MAG: glycosyltransferase family 2 protein [Candidatus Aenigmarchaeota archaeon]|nr:glycosyltransferase family 2 protein [Candidatus Aenigmarchaeota archaeon]